MANNESSSMSITSNKPSPYHQYNSSGYTTTNNHHFNHNHSGNHNSHRSSGSSNILMQQYDAPVFTNEYFDQIADKYSLHANDLEQLTLQQKLEEV
jgi:hypothetical protein